MTSAALATFAGLAVLLVLIPSVVLAAECVTALLYGSRERRSGRTGSTPRFCVLIPAQDEAVQLPSVLESVFPELGGGSHCLVVAHNCTDATAETARALGAGVIEVCDDGQGGKPAAVSAGLEALDADPPDVVVIVDADCRVRAGSLVALAEAAAEHGGPVQGVYLFTSRDDPLSRASSLALALKNWIRPLGLSHLDLPCLLNGSGSAYPFELLRHAPHGTGSLAEDYQLCVDLARLGHFTRFVPAARIESALPGSRADAVGQRTRWEHGHLDLALRTAPRLLVAAVVQRSLPLAGLALELLVPPLAFLGVAWAIAGLLALSAALLGSGPPLAILMASGLGVASAVLLAWVRFCGAATTFRALSGLPAYVVWKLPLYARFWTDPERRWKRTGRS